MRNWRGQFSGELQVIGGTTDDAFLRESI
jgi:hypothetical protein